MLPDPVRRGLRLARHFEGRDSRAQFWPYAGTVTAVLLVGGNVVIATVMVLVLAGPAEYWEAAGPVVLVGTLAVVVVGAALLAAAVTRRLHDRGHRGGWAMVPLVALLAAMGLMAPAFLAVEEDPDLALFFTSFGMGLLYFASLGVLVLQLALPGTETADEAAAG